MTTPHPAELWDFDDPAGSEHRFREQAEIATGADRHVFLTQAARALGLQERYADAHALLDDVDHAAGPDCGHEVAVRLLLERGRLLRSADRADEAAPVFAAAAGAAAAAGLEELEIDALHMAALVAPAADQVALTRDALNRARASSDPRARGWAASLLNNLGMAHADAGEWEDARAAFDAALVERERHDDVGATRIARWMVGWAMRHQGDREGALAMQRALRAELAAAGAEDPYVEEELALLEGEE